MTERPDVGRDGRDIRCRQIRATERRHRTDGPFRDRHAPSNGPAERLHAAVAPDPATTCQIGPDDASLAVRRVTATAGATAGLTVKDVIAQDQLFARDP